MIDIHMLRDLTNAFGPSGFEEETVRVIVEYCQDMDWVNDAMNNVYVRLEGPVLEALADGSRWAGRYEGDPNRTPAAGQRRKRKCPVIMLDAHTDVLGLGIRIGDPAAPEVSFEYDRERELFFGKAFDNRMGCACILHTMRELNELKKQGWKPEADVVALLPHGKRSVPGERA